VIDAPAFVEAARQRGYGLWSGVPCSYLQPFINFTIGASGLRYVSAANEGDAVAIASGAELGGTRGVAMFQNSGLGNAISPLTSLNAVFRLPVLVIVTLRGEPGGAPDEPQHAMMGAITTRLLEDMSIPWEYFPTEDGGIAPCLDRADSAARSGKPHALVMRKDSVKAWPAPAAPRREHAVRSSGRAEAAKYPRHELLKALQASVKEEDILVATTGYTGRELYALEDRPNQFYMVGSMGCASSFGLGLALARPERRVIVLDGDGAALMRLGALAAIGREQPANLVHVVLDNGVHESTGGQPVALPGADFVAIAAALGYASAAFAATPEALAERVAGAKGPALIQAAVLPGVMPNLPRPKISPPEVAARLRAFLSS
jgi:phosphonopyruvate decarboxylase